MAETSRDSDRVNDIKQKLENVLSSLEKYKQPNNRSEIKQVDEQIISIEERTSELLEEKIAKIREDFKHQITKTVLDFNLKIESSTENLRSHFKSLAISSDSSTIFIEKVHKRQSAPISKLLYSKDFQTIYNIFLAILVNIGIAELARDLLESNSSVGFELFTGNFGKLDHVFKAWILMHIWSFTTIIIVQQRHLPSLFLCFLHIVTIIIQGTFVISHVIDSKLPIASSFIVLCEMARFDMKMHSYFREKLLYGNGENSYSKFIPFHLENKFLEAQTPKINIKSFYVEAGRFNHFLFVPTLIYRDSYPKLDRSIRWRNLSVHLFNFFGAIIYTTLIFKAYCVQEFDSASKNITNTQAVLLSWFRAMLPGTMVFLLLFFAVMHSWFSIWAEVLNFADRKFYDDWWNSKDFGTFYKKISVIIYEWLHIYVYIDAQRFTKQLIGPLGARVFVFVFSGVVTELIIDLSLGFFFPYVFMIIAAPGAFMISMKNEGSKFYNVFVWGFLIMMLGLIMMLYSLEYYYCLDKADKRDFEKYGTLAYFIPQWIYQLSFYNR